VWTGHGAIVSCLPQGHVIQCLWGMWIGTWELALVKTRVLLALVKTRVMLKKFKSWKLFVKFRFRGVSQTLHATDMTAMQGTSDLFFITKFVFVICVHLGTNFPHHITIHREVALYCTCTLLQVLQKLEWCVLFMVRLFNEGMLQGS